MSWGVEMLLYKMRELSWWGSLQLLHSYPPATRCEVFSKGKSQRSTVANQAQTKFNWAELERETERRSNGGGGGGQLCGGQTGSKKKTAERKKKGPTNRFGGSVAGMGSKFKRGNEELKIYSRRKFIHANDNYGWPSLTTPLLFFFLLCLLMGSLVRSLPFMA